MRALQKTDLQVRLQTDCRPTARRLWWRLTCRNAECTGQEVGFDDTGEGASHKLNKLGLALPRVEQTVEQPEPS